jgi:hypothetical protein
MILCMVMTSQTGRATAVPQGYVKVVARCIELRE